MFPPIAVQRAMIERLRPAMEQVNAKVPDGERYSLELQEPFIDTETLRFSREQLDLIGDVLGRHLAVSRGEKLAFQARLQLTETSDLIAKGNSPVARARLDAVFQALRQLKDLVTAPQVADQLMTRALGLKKQIESG